MRDRIASLVLMGALTTSLAGCAGGLAPGATPTVTVTATPEPAPTVTVAAERSPNAVLTPLEAWTICASAGLADLGPYEYKYAEPLDPQNITDNGDSTFTVRVDMDVTGGLQPVHVECQVSGSMGDPRVTFDVVYDDE